MITKLYLGIDVSKGYADFVLINSTKEELFPPYQLDDTPKGHDQLYHLLERLFKGYTNLELYCGVESTGGYENNWYSQIKRYSHEFDVKIVRLNPSKVKNTKEAELPGNTTDPISARAIAYHLLNLGDNISYEIEDRYAAIRNVWIYIHKQIKQSTELLNHFESLLYSSHPGLVQFCKTGVPEWLLKLVQKYPTARKLSKASVVSITKIPYISEPRAIELKALSKQTVASLDDAFSALLMSDLAKKILDHKETIKTWKKELENRCDFPEIKHLITIPGIGLYGAIGIMLNLGAIQQFKSAKSLASYWGLHPEIKISGDKQRVSRMSKKGRTVPREILYMAVLSLIRGDNHMRDMYDYYVEEKRKSKMSAICILMHKLTRVIYGMLKNQTDYDENVDIANQNTTKRIKQKMVGNIVTRRYQKYDIVAPISGQQSRKRKEQIKSQNALTFNTGSNICSN